MTNKSEAQPEALRLADRLEDFALALPAYGFDDRPPQEAALELRRQHAEIQQLKAEKAEMTALNFENYEFQRKKADAATATVYRFHYAMKDAGWHPGRTDDDLTDIIRAKGRELAQLSARQAVSNPWQQAIDHELVCLHLGVAGEATQESALKALRELIQCHVEIAINPQTNGGFSLQPHPATPLPEREPQCWCETCDTTANNGLRTRMSLCPTCGNKRCPKPPTTTTPAPTATRQGSLVRAGSM